MPMTAGGKPFGQKMVWNDVSPEQLLSVILSGLTPYKRVNKRLFFHIKIDGAGIEFSCDIGERIDLDGWALHKAECIRIG